MKIIATSDLHGVLPEIDPCDLLLIGGDVLPDFGWGLGPDTIKGQQRWQEAHLRPWLRALIDRGTSVVGIAGNHDFLWEKTDAAYYLPWSYLQDEAVEVNDLKIHGTPWCPVLRAWAFYGNDVLLEEKAALIPKCDILIAHSPPYGYGDRVLSGEHVGNRAIPTDAAPVIITGHIHEAYGLHRASFLDVYNVSHMDVHYNPINPPVEIYS